MAQLYCHINKNTLKYFKKESPAVEKLAEKPAKVWLIESFSNVQMYDGQNDQNYLLAV